MAAVAKREMQAAGHAPAAATVLFQDCVVAVVKVAPCPGLLPAGREADSKLRVFRKRRQHA